MTADEVSPVRRSEAAVNLSSTTNYTAPLTSHLKAIFCHFFSVFSLGVRKDVKKSFFIQSEFNMVPFYQNELLERSCDFKIFENVKRMNKSEMLHVTNGGTIG